MEVAELGTLKLSRDQSGFELIFSLGRCAVVGGVDDRRRICGARRSVCPSEMPACVSFVQTI